jgi:hypothetical protein
MRMLRIFRPREKLFLFWVLLKKRIGEKKIKRKR